MSGETVKIGGRSYRRFIAAPEPVDDGTVRCIACGQIDEDPWHDMNVCRAIRKRHFRALTIADRLGGGRPSRCWGWKAKIWDAAYNAAIAAIPIEDPITVEASFLLDRLGSLEFTDLEQTASDYYGHVMPSVARLRGLLDAVEGADQ